ncbi:MAG: metal-dependent phosphohydrolase [Comamonadaceae bacterium CG_4_9_14_0_8_um_filter_57_21]|nr:MAG: metal-dependent phosphohydrolase [Comamonadaceae bacterium CG_4_10_14_0_8_um_filter_57_29]PJC13285.1 MAG: metal-dependent phosphohydrolase [Comamonadaceae bacterium CG_4_9_14_0_8_um_filter_57_21]
MPVTSPVAEALYIDPDHLRPGLYVMLDLPWFRHNFTLNNFKIRSDLQVRELRDLRLKHYRIDPTRSDPEALQSLITQPAPSAAPRDEPAQTHAVASDAQRATQARKRVIAQRQQAIANVERAFGKAVSTMKNLNRNLLAKPQETLLDMGELVGHMMDAFLESPEATLHVMGDRVGGEEVYFHSLNVTILSMMLAKDLGFDAVVARDLGIGAMVHDIGLIDIPAMVLGKDPDDYNQAERSLRQMHVEYGSKIAAKLGLTPGALAIVNQHHEFIDGSGYPNKLKGEQMTEAARLVSLVNHYDNLCNPVNHKKALTPHQALSFIFAQRKSKFDAKALQLMVRSLGVYPPGSIVHLSNDMLATVTAVNPKKPLRPWILVFDETIPKDEALVINLEETPEITITKAIAPALLPPKAMAYLNPRKRVTYFFDGADANPPT